MNLFSSILPGSAGTYVTYFVIFMIIYGIGIVFYMKKKKASQDEWHKLNPTAAKVYVTNKSYLVKSEGLYVHSVDDEAPHTFIEAMKTGFFVLPPPRHPYSGVVIHFNSSRRAPQASEPYLGAQQTGNHCGSWQKLQLFL